MPGDVQVSPLGGNMVRVSWTPPPEVDCYVVRYGVQGSTALSSIEVETPATEVILEGLDAGVTYEITVQAFATFPGPESDIVMVTLTGKHPGIYCMACILSPVVLIHCLVSVACVWILSCVLSCGTCACWLILLFSLFSCIAPAPPQSVTVRVSSSTSLEVSWSAVQDAMGYEISFAPGVGACEGVEGESVLVEGGGTGDHTLQQLEEFTEYIIVIRSQGVHGVGMSSDPMSATTLKDSA